MERARWIIRCSVLRGKEREKAVMFAKGERLDGGFKGVRGGARRVREKA